MRVDSGRVCRDGEVCRMGRCAGWGGVQDGENSELYIVNFD